MAPRQSPSIRIVPDDDDAPEPLEVNETRPSQTIHVDSGGNVYSDNGDGSLGVNIPPEQPERGPSSFNDNLADDEEVPLATIAHHLLESIEADIRSRAEWEEMMNKGAELLGIKLEEASSQVSPEGTISKARHTVLLEAVTRSWANSRAELLPANGPVKVKDDATPLSSATGNGPAMPGQPKRSELAEALETDMNHYLTVVDKEYYPDFSRMLFSRALNGVEFRKVYRCPIKRRPSSIWVKSANLIVSNDASHLQSAGRISERIMMRRSMVKRMQKSGHWRDIELIQPTQVPSPTDTTIGKIQGTEPTPQLPADHQHTIYECYCELDDGALKYDETGSDVGFPLPYRVTIDKDSKTVLEIRRNWREGDEDFKPRIRYVKYGFVPGLGFYDLGYTHLLGNPERTLTAIERLLIDAGFYASFPGGVMAKGPGTRQRTNEVRPDPGQFAVIDTGGQPIQQVVMPMPYKEPSAVLQNVGAEIANDARRLAGVLELPVGEGRVGDVPVGTIMSYIDAISKVPSAVHKDDHTAQQEEFELMRELFMEEPEALTRYNKSPARDQYTAEELEDQNLVPASDPNIPSQTHRVMQTTALVQMAGLPQFAPIANQMEIFERAVRVLGVEDAQSVINPPQPSQPAPPPPQVVAAQLRNQGEAIKANTQITTAKINQDTKNTELQAKLLDNAADRKLEQQKAGIGFLSDMAGTAQQHQQHLNEMGQANLHKAADLLAAQESANQQPPEGQS